MDIKRFDGVAISCARSSTVPYVDQMEEPTPTRVNYKLGICAMAPESVRLTMENADFRRVVKKEILRTSSSTMYPSAPESH
ncbi:hypothetical protein OUZ56_031439 [Daphnia magna]|uniref:Uncharacterized protein n=1 Tax=Daphnia magna TaxID=35525 RepID=A0ABQ9ZU87_9CRUS|nr:hypothetical protein OUZ56_031439 [Daphnia magna]